jgi:hypothetical protein
VRTHASYLALQRAEGAILVLGSLMHLRGCRRKVQESDAVELCGDMVASPVFVSPYAHETRLQFCSSFLRFPLSAKPRHFHKQCDLLERFFGKGTGHRAPAGASTTDKFGRVYTALAEIYKGTDEGTFTRECAHRCLVVGTAWMKSEAEVIENVREMQEVLDEMAAEGGDGAAAAEDDDDNDDDGGGDADDGNKAAPSGGGGGSSSLQPGFGQRGPGQRPTFQRATCSAAGCEVVEVLKGDKESNFKRCSRCRVARYCSAACQKRDWKDHKKYCQPISTANNQ